MFCCTCYLSIKIPKKRKSGFEIWPLAFGWSRSQNPFPSKICYSFHNLSDLSTRNVLKSDPLAIRACVLLSNPVKVPNFQYRILLYYYISRMMKKVKNSDFLPSWSTAIIWPMDQNSNIWHSTDRI
jgi:hypothetical protein